MSSREKSRAPSKAAIEAMIEEATVDAYGEEEQAMGWQYALEENLELPFTTKVLGVEVKVDDIELRGDNSIAAYRSFSRGARS